MKFAQIVEKKKILNVFIKMENTSEDNKSHAKKKEEKYIPTAKKEDQQL